MRRVRHAVSWIVPFLLCVIAIATLHPVAAVAAPGADAPQGVTFATPQEAVSELLSAARHGDVDGVPVVYAEPYASLLRDSIAAGTAVDLATQDLAAAFARQQSEPGHARALEKPYAVFQSADAALVEARGRQGLRAKLGKDAALLLAMKVKTQEAESSPDRVLLTLEVLWRGSDNPRPVIETITVLAVKQTGGWKLASPGTAAMTAQEIKELEASRVEPVQKLASALDKIAKDVREGVYPKREDGLAAAQAAVQKYRDALAKIPVGSPAFLPGQHEGDGAGSPMNDLMNARRVVFVCDTTGSMINRLEFAKEAVSHAISSLHAFQKFDLLAFHEESVASAWKTPGLQDASVDDKHRAAEFIEGTVTTGGGDPTKAMETAFQEHPDVIFLLTDGDFDNGDKLLARLRELNAGGRVKVNVLGFIAEGAAEAEAGEKLLRQIAEQNGGAYQRMKTNEDK